MSADDNATIDVRAGDELDWPRLDAHLRSVIELPAAAMSVRQFSAGRANLTYELTFGEVRLVLRRPPRGDLPPGAHDMAREHRVLSRLSPVYPRAPLPLHFSDNISIVGAPFIVLERRTGEVIRASVPASMAHHADVERRVDLALLRAAADLHVIDPVATGLGDLAKHDGFAERQVSGWRRRWDRAAPDDSGGPMHEAAAELERTLPAQQRLSVVHNDLKLDNCQFHADDPDTVTSVFDWDMATLGDPLFDLGSMLVSMETVDAWVVSNDEAAAAYSTASDIDCSQLGWYVAFATWRTAVVLQQLVNRYERGDSVDDRMAGAGRHVQSYAERALALLG